MFYTQEQMINTSCLSGQSGPVTEIKFFKDSTSNCAIRMLLTTVHVKTKGFN